MQAQIGEVPQWTKALELALLSEKDADLRIVGGETLYLAGA